MSADPEVRAALDDGALAELFDPARFLRNLGRVFERLEKLPVRGGADPSSGVTGELVAQRARSATSTTPGDDALLLVATDRISAFDVVLPDPIPDKGRVLTGLSLYWFERSADLVGNHLLSGDRATFPAPFADEPSLAGRAAARAPRRRRAARVRRARLPQRQRAGRSTARPARCAASRCPPGLVESDRLPEPIFTPTTKAAEGHDLPLTPDEAADLVGRGLVRAAEGAHPRALRAARRGGGRARRASWPTRSSSSGSPGAS